MKRPAYLQLVKTPSAPVAAPAVPVYQLNSLDALSGEMFAVCSFAGALASAGILSEHEIRDTVIRWYDDYCDGRLRPHAMRTIGQCFGGTSAADTDPDSPTTPFYEEEAG